MPATTNNTATQTKKARKPRLLMVAFACHPKQSMETRIGWRRALLAADSCETTVLVGPGASAVELQAYALQERGDTNSLRFIDVNHDWQSGLLCSYATTYYLGYRRWCWLAYQAGKQLHKQQPFDLTHQVTYCGYREPGLIWKLDIPFVWGPVGGTQDFPRRFLSTVSPVDGVREMCRSMLNWWQLRFCPRVGRAIRKAAILSAATNTGRDHLHQALGVDANVELETGLDCKIAAPRVRRDSEQPLRVLWAGRLRPWKGLPLLIQALKLLPKNAKVVVRVLGQGPCLDSWQRQTERAGVGHLIEWVDWTEYDQTLPHYRWADVFAFTSLRDTSGTGLLESLAMGAPIIGLNHQGAADIMTADCAIPVPVTTPRETAQAMANAIKHLATDADELLRLSQGAQLRAQAFDWRLRVETTRLMYQRAMHSNGTESVESQGNSLNLTREPTMADAGAITTTA